MNHHHSAGQNEEATLAGDPVGTHGAALPASPNVTVFRCVNSSRPGAAGPAWPMPVREIALPCTGRLQPEHLLKAFEAGADAVCVITCAGHDCHYLEGSDRAQRRVEYVRELLDEIGLGGHRLLFVDLATSQQAIITPDRGPNDSSPSTRLNEEELGSRLAEICERVMVGLGAVQPSPLRQNRAGV